MKKMVFILALFSFISISVFSQDLKKEVNETASAFDGTIEGLQDLVTKVEAIRNLGFQEFATAQADMNKKKEELAKRRIAIEQQSKKEASMSYEALKELSKARTQLVQEENRLQYNQQVFNLEKQKFDNRMRQIEQHIIGTFAKQIAYFNTLYGKNIKAYLSDLRYKK